MIDSISEFPEGTMDFEAIGEHVNASFKKSLTKLLDKRKIWLIVYALIDAANIFVDSIMFLVLVIMFGVEGHEYADMWLLFVCLIFLATDWFYVLWALATFAQLPGSQRKNFIKSVVGLGASLQNKLGQKKAGGQE